MKDLSNVSVEYIQEHIAPVLFSGKSILSDDALKEKVGDFWMAYVLYEEKDGKISRTLVSKETASRFCFLSECKSVYASAMDNLKRMSHFRIDPVSDILSRFVPGFDSGNDGNDEPLMYVLYGNPDYSVSALILDPGVQKKIADMSAMKDGYYIIPSSIHEIIIVPKNRCASVASLNAIVRFVNSDCVSPEERLSDHVYEIRDGALCAAEDEEDVPQNRKKIYEVTVSDSATYRILAESMEEAEDYAAEMFSERIPDIRTVTNTSESNSTFDVEI